MRLQIQNLGFPAATVLLVAASHSLWSKALVKMGGPIVQVIEHWGQSAHGEVVDFRSWGILQREPPESPMHPSRILKILPCCTS
jgi:hypothetical protein